VADLQGPLSLAGKSVLITGGAGFIGSYLAERVAREGPAKLCVVDTMFLGREENLSGAWQSFAGLKVFRQDAADYNAMSAITSAERVDVVYNLAVVPLPTSLVNPRWTVEVNLGITTVACELLRQGYYRTLIQFSSSEAYGTAAYVPMDETHPGQPSTPYAASKLGSDLIVLGYRETYGIDATIVRPFNNYGPRQNAGTYAGVIPSVVGRCLRGERVEVFGDGEQTRDYVFVTDTAEAAIRAYEEPASRGLVINVGSGREVSVNELVDLIQRLLGTSQEVIHLAPRPGDVRRHRAANDRARTILGFEPRVGIEEGMSRTLAWYRSELGG
jgi:UDP-glucose 4-epimerase